jgi:hypothetical protein
VWGSQQIFSEEVLSEMDSEGVVSPWVSGEGSVQEERAGKGTWVGSSECDQ